MYIRLFYLTMIPFVEMENCDLCNLCALSRHVFSHPLPRTWGACRRHAERRKHKSTELFLLYPLPLLPGKRKKNDEDMKMKKWASHENKIRLDFPRPYIWLRCFTSKGNNKMKKVDTAAVLGVVHWSSHGCRQDSLIKQYLCCKKERKRERRKAIQQKLLCYFGEQRSEHKWCLEEIGWKGKEKGCTKVEADNIMLALSEFLSSLFYYDGEEVGKANKSLNGFLREGM